MELNKKAYLTEDLEQFSTTQLQQVLRAELNCDAPNGQLVQAILRTLEAREDDYTETDDEAVEAACDRYRAYCESIEADRRRKTSGVRKLVLRAASLAVIVGILLFAVPRAEAGRFREMLVRWTESVFELFGATYTDNDEIEYEFKTEHPGLQQVYDAVTAMGVTGPSVPSWMPEEQVLYELKSTETQSKRGILATFTDGDCVIAYTVDIYDPELAHTYFKDVQNPNKYEYDGVLHSITSNDGTMMAIWTRDNIGFSITADCQEDTLYKIIDSIYTMEAD